MYQKALNGGFICIFLNTKKKRFFWYRYDTEIPKKFGIGINRYRIPSSDNFIFPLLPFFTYNNFTSHINPPIK